MITDKQEFFKHFHYRAEESADIARPKNREAYIETCLENMWNEYNRWYKEKYSQAYRDSLTLEQLYRLDH